MTTTRLESGFATRSSVAAGLAGSAPFLSNGCGPKARGTVRGYPTPNVVGISVRAA